jgi:2-oxoisovalerate dehydrogenase E1 component
MSKDEILALYEATRSKCFAAAEDADRGRIETLDT